MDAAMPIVSLHTKQRWSAIADIDGDGQEELVVAVVHLFHVDWATVLVSMQVGHSHSKLPESCHP